MYYQHFGLDQAPFRITPNTDFFFSGGNRGPILEALIYSIAHGEGIVKVTGEVGSGKTMLCNMLQARLPANVETIYLAHPNVQPEEILHAIAFELQLPVERSAPRIEVMHRLHDHLLARHAEGKRVVMFVDESQSMPLATLEELRLLSNLETRNDKLLQIVLFGQPELDDNLAEPRIRQLKERITHSFRLGPLSASETREYLMFRLRAAGYRGPDLFSGKVVNCIARASRGLTRRINLIADKALLAAFSENTHTVRLAHVKDAVRDSEFGREQGSRRGMQAAWGLGLLATGALGGALAYALVFEDARQGGNAPRMANITAATAAASASLTYNPSAPGGLPAPVRPAPSAAPVETVAPDGPPASSGADTMVERRFAASRAWLTDAPPTAFSIQLMGVEDESQLKRHLNDLAKSIEINKVFLYRSVANRKALLTVLYGSFVDRRAAQEALDALPAELQVNRPFLRTVRGIRAE
ncbi:MAG: AAA family ATPase, partial [Betaproteobacteria bacterium]